ncbi:MAG: tyrosine-type recombinase/integrase [Armatimonadetes bacterium]|nr:tyrosine-type recombinase/integrase [Armatimonadota bacterium]
MTRFAKPWYRKGRGWYLEIDGKQVKLADDRDQAFDRYHKLMAGQSPTGTPVSSVIDSFLDWCMHNRAERTFDWHKERCDSFWQHLKSLGLSVLTVEELRPFHLDAWLRTHPGWSPGMQRGALVSIQRAFNWAIKQGLIVTSPIEGLEKPPQGRRENVIAPATYQVILEHVKGQAFRDLLITAWEIGCRPQEIVRVEARHFNQGRWVFPKEESKGKKRIRVVHLTPTAEEITKRRAQQFPDGPIFRNRAGRPWHPWAINCRFCRLQKKIGKKFALVDFRHSFVTRLLKEGVDPITIGALCGHADLSMIARVYAHVHQDAEHLRKALMKGA